MKRVRLPQKDLPEASTVTSLIADFEKRLPIYSNFAERLAQLVKVLTEEHEDKIHSITKRVKSVKSLEGKIRSKQKYSNLDQITDIVALRVITLYEEDVSVIAKIIEKNFTIDSNNSADKGKELAANQFGYKSVHYIAKLGPERIRLREYKSFIGINFEIQIRTIIQHAWAEIEHKLGYKSDVEVPLPIKRRFFRLAALLEVADNEFSSLKNDLNAYKIGLSGRIRSTPASVPIDSASLDLYLKFDKLIKRLNQQLARQLKKKYIDRREFQSPWDFWSFKLRNQLKYLAVLNITTIGELDDALKTNGNMAIKLAKEIFLNQTPPWEDYDIDNTTVMFFLYYVLVAKSNDVDKLVEYLTKSDISVGGSPSDWARTILDTYNALIEVTAQS